MMPAILDVRGIEKSFGNLKVLNGLDVQANAGDVISILGSSGSGKSTFLRCINLLEMPDKGEIFLNGEQLNLSKSSQSRKRVVNAKQIDRLRAQLSMVFQSFNLWSHLTVVQNVALAPMKVLGKSKAEAIEAAEYYLERVGVLERKDYYPAHLSGGQQQRAAIARALAMEPQALLFDEPTSALDPELVGEVLKVMHQLAEEGRTMLVVTHEMGFARDVSTKILFLNEGRIERQGTPDEMFSAEQDGRWRTFLAHTRS